MSRIYNLHVCVRVILNVFTGSEDGNQSLMEVLSSRSFCDRNVISIYYLFIIINDLSMHGVSSRGQKNTTDHHLQSPAASLEQSDNNPQHFRESHREPESPREGL